MCTLGRNISNFNLPSAHIATGHFIARVFSIISVSVLRDLATESTPQPTSPWPVPLPCSTRTMECKQRGWMDGWMDGCDASESDDT